MFTHLEKCKTIAFSACLLLCSFSSTAEKSDLSSLNTQAAAIVKQFGGTLKPQLQQALKDGGVKQAIEVCAVKAPQIAKDLSLSSHWQVKRVSLKARNNHDATPDAWEKATLEAFNQRQQQGESTETLVKSEIINNEFRFMKAQGVAPLCLNCHGSELSNDAKAALAQHYPDDQATGYSLGEIRGAFSLTKKL